MDFSITEALNMPRVFDETLYPRISARSSLFKEALDQSCDAALGRLEMSKGATQDGW